MKILLAADGSRAALNAVQSLIKNLEWYKEKPTVDLLYVHLPITVGGSIHGIAVNTGAIERYYEEDAQQALKETKQLLTSAGVRFDTHLRIGKIAEEICTFAQENGSALICMGTRGMGSIGNMLLGSIAMKVLHLAKVPVLLVPDVHAHAAKWQEPAVSDFRT